MFKSRLISLTFVIFMIGTNQVFSARIWTPEIEDDLNIAMAVIPNYPFPFTNANPNTVTPPTNPFLQNNFSQDVLLGASLLMQLSLSLNPSQQVTQGQTLQLPPSNTTD